MALYQCLFITKNYQIYNINAVLIHQGLDGTIDDYFPSFLHKSVLLFV